MQQTCSNGWCKQSFEVGHDDLAFYDKVSPVFGEKKYPVPAPYHCPQCRQQRRLAWRNEQHLYSRDCDLCKRKIVSVHKPGTPYPVYCVRCFWSDWNALDFGIDYDPTKSFFEQFKELQNRVPQLAIQNDEGIGSENSEYCYDISRAKNCYRLVGSWYDEECHYSLNINRSKFVVDSNTVSIQSELVYESLDSQRIYHCAYVQNCQNCHDCFFGYDLKGCADCFGCFGLRQKKFCIFNEQHSEEDYRKKMSEFSLGSFGAIEDIQKKFDAWVLQFPRLFANLQNCEESSGNNLFNCKQVHNSYSVFDSEYCKFIDRSDKPKNCYDMINTGAPEWCYDCVTPDDSYMVLFSVWCWKSKYILLSDNCHSSKNLCGCISLRRNEYCILNKQYSKEEYEEKVGQILSLLQGKNEWGELLPMNLSPFAYNESAASEYYPLKKDEVTSRGWRWTDELPYTTGKETISMQDIPDDIANVKDTITNEVLGCIDCQRNYKITPQELSFYRKMPCPLPRRCPNCRHLKRFQKKTPTNLWNRTCMKCSKDIETTYAPEKPEIVYCEECYLKEVY